jgi:Protein of unknown function (DUF2591)
MKQKTQELEGAQLDWAVGKANGWISYPTDSMERGEIWHTESEKAPFGKLISGYHPSTDWAQAGPIIEDEKLGIVHAWEGAEWLASAFSPEAPVVTGPTPLIAAMRCYVASKLGDEVEIPEELL